MWSVEPTKTLVTDVSCERLHWIKHPIAEDGRDAAEKDNSDFSPSNLLLRSTFWVPQTLWGDGKLHSHTTFPTVKSLSHFHLFQHFFQILFLFSNFVDHISKISLSILWFLINLNKMHVPSTLWATDPQFLTLMSRLVGLAKKENTGLAKIYHMNPT